MITKKQLNYRIKKLLAEKAFDIHEYSVAKPKKTKHREFFYALENDMFDIVWESDYKYTQTYETLQFDTLLNNRIFLRIVPRYTPKEYFKKYKQELTHGGANNLQNVQLRIRSIKEEETNPETNPVQNDSETVHI